MGDYFKVRCTGNEDGSYLLSYGKGGKKLEARLSWGVGGWACGEFLFPLKRDVVKAWGAWAAAKYAGQDTPVSLTSSATPDNAASLPQQTASPTPQGELTDCVVIIKGRPPTKCSVSREALCTIYRDIGGNEYLRIRS